MSVFISYKKGTIERVFFHADLAAGVRTSGWQPVCERTLSANGGVDDLVPAGTLKRGLYLIEFDFTGVDVAARQIYRKNGAGGFERLNPTGFFMAARSALTLKARECICSHYATVCVVTTRVT